MVWASGAVGMPATSVGNDPPPPLRGVSRMGEPRTTARLAAVQPHSRAAEHAPTTETTAGGTARDVLWMQSYHYIILHTFCCIVTRTLFRRNLNSECHIRGARLEYGGR